MVHVSFLLSLVVALTTSVHAGDLVGEIQWNEVCQNYTTLGQARVVIDNGFAHGNILKDGSFLIPDVNPGTYTLSVIARDHKFDQLRVDVPPDASVEPEIRPYLIGTPLNPPTDVLLPYPIKLSPRLANSYYTPPESFNLMAMLMNPMALMMVAGAAMLFGMPYLTKNLDPELMQEIQQSQAKVAGFQSALQSGDIRSGMAALMPSEEEKRPTVVPAAQQSSGKKSLKKRR